METSLFHSKAYSETRLLESLSIQLSGRKLDEFIEKILQKEELVIVSSIIYKIKGEQNEVFKLLKTMIKNQDLIRFTPQTNMKSL